MTEDEDVKTEQTAVADANEETKKSTSADGGAAQKDGLDELLKEFESKDETPEEKKVETKREQTDDRTAELEALAVLERRLNDQEAREQRRELEATCVKLAEGTQGDALDAEAYLIAQAKRNPKLEQLYVKRASNPKAWDEALGILQKDFAKRWGKKIDKQVTDSREAVASAVRSASTAAPTKDLSDKDVQQMSKSDFDELQRKLGVSPV